ncbi:MAG: glycogen synthase, partial [Chloroflexi bacterium]|nr:glycogen synthase [Chloroflexota bacterium]
QPDVIHCNDWHTAIVPAWLHTIYRDNPFYSRCASVFTIHNLAYQGVCGDHFLALAGFDRDAYRARHPEDPNCLNLMSEAILYSDVINTVSESYAREILTPEYGEQMHNLLANRSDRLFGILNGIDYEVFDPARDPHIAVSYDVASIDKKVENKLALQRRANLTPDPKIPLIGAIGRMADQKGFDLIAAAIDPIIQELGAQFVLLGTGEAKYHRLFEELAHRYPSQAAVYLTFDADLAQKIYAGSDMFLMPSRFEPCGLGQLISLRYGTVPIVRETGGLADTVNNYNPRTGHGNGFTFKHYHRDALLTAVARACENFKHRDAWKELMRKGMSEDYSWGASAGKYVDLYRQAIKFHEQETEVH